MVNLGDFRAILAFDKWRGNADGRQCVFDRAMVRSGDTGGARAGFGARMIDHGYTFHGAQPGLSRIGPAGLYARRVVYGSVRSLDDITPWLDRAVHFPEEVIDLAWKRIPPDWVYGEEESLGRLLKQRAANWRPRC